MQPSVMARVSLVALPLLLVASAVGVALRPRMDLVLVNPSAEPVRVRVLGDPLAVPANTTLRLDHLPAGRLRVAASGGSSLEVDAAGGSTWVWAVAPVTTWWQVSMGYGDLAHVGSSATPFAAPGPLFALPDEGFLSVVDAPLPTQARVKRGTTGAVLSGLWSDGYADRAAPRTVNLDVHNGSQATVRLELEGRPPITLPHGSMLHVEGLRPGTLPLRAVVVDATGDGRVYGVDADLAPAAPLAPAPTYVWDVDGTTRWWAISRRYGPAPDALPVPPPHVLETDGPLFRLPDGFFPEIDAPFPDTWHRVGVVQFLHCQSLYERGAAARTPPDLPRQPSRRRRREAARAAEREAPAPAPRPADAPFPPVADDDQPPR